MKVLRSCEVWKMKRKRMKSFMELGLKMLWTWTCFAFLFKDQFKNFNLHWIFWYFSFMFHSQNSFTDIQTTWKMKRPQEKLRVPFSEFSRLKICIWNFSFETREEKNRNMNSSTLSFPPMKPRSCVIGVALASGKILKNTAVCRRAKCARKNFRFKFYRRFITKQ